MIEDAIEQERMRREMIRTLPDLGWMLRGLRDPNMGLKELNEVRDRNLRAAGWDPSKFDDDD